MAVAVAVVVKLWIPRREIVYSYDEKMRQEEDSASISSFRFVVELCDWIRCWLMMLNEGCVLSSYRLGRLMDEWVSEFKINRYAGHGMILQNFPLLRTLIVSRAHLLNLDIQWRSCIIICMTLPPCKNSCSLFFLSPIYSLLPPIELFSCETDSCRCFLKDKHRVTP